MKRLFLLFAFLFCFFQVVPQEKTYIITELELERLEVICQNWENSKQTLQLQVQNLRVKLTEALTKSNDLSEQLKVERATSKSLRKSFNEYETEVQTKLNNTNEKIQKLEKKAKRRLTAVIVLSCVLGVVIILLCIYIYVKGIKKTKWFY